MTSRGKLQIVVVNDGSTDNTWQHITRAAARHSSLVTCIDLGCNMGKRAAVTAGIRATEPEIIVSVDSDSLPAPSAVRKLVQGFADHKVGAISGLTYVRNATTNLLTRMQARVTTSTSSSSKPPNLSSTRCRARAAASAPTGELQSCRYSTIGRTRTCLVAHGHTVTIAP